MFKFAKAAESGPAAPASDRPIRSLVKAVSWRITGSLDTMLLSWLFTGDLSIAAAIGLTEVLTKMVLYYGHERIWNRIPLGRGVVPEKAVDRIFRVAKAARSACVGPVASGR